MSLARVDNALGWHDVTIGEINSGRNGSAGLGYAVAPGTLAIYPHHQQGPVFKHDFMGRKILSASMPQEKSPRTAKTDGRNYRIRAEFSFVIAVPTHAVVA